MPIYEYHCNTDQGGCGHQFEEIQSFTDVQLTVCPQCKQSKLQRLFGLPGLIFKGSGWTQKNSDISTEA